MPFNDLASDGLVRHNISLLRYDAATRRKIRSMLRSLQEDITNKLGSYSFADAASKARLEKLLAQVDEMVKVTYKQVNNTMLGEMGDLAKAEHAFASQQLNSLFGVDIVSAGMTPQALRALAKDTVVLGAPAAEHWGRQSANMRRRFSDEMRKGFLLGEGTGDLVRRVRGTSTGKREIIELANGKTKSVHVFEGGIMDATTREAEALVRTSVQSIANEARFQTYMQNTDVIQSVQAQVTLDNRTSQECIAHGALPDEWTLPDMEPVGGSNHFIGPPPWHYNCRSSLVPVTKSWEQLQQQGNAEGATREQRSIARKLDNNAPKRTRASMDGQVPRSTNYDQWLRDQPASVQTEVLGVTRRKLWQEGKINLSQTIDQTGRPLTLKQLGKTNESIFGAEAYIAPPPLPKWTLAEIKGASVGDEFMYKEDAWKVLAVNKDGVEAVHWSTRTGKFVTPRNKTVIKFEGGIGPTTPPTPPVKPPKPPTKKPFTNIFGDDYPEGVEIKRSADFASDGSYYIRIPGHRQQRIFRDPADGWWYLDEQAGGGINRFSMLSTETGKDALKDLLRKFPPKGTTPVPPVKPLPPGAPPNPPPGWTKLYVGNDETLPALKKGSIFHRDGLYYKVTGKTKGAVHARVWDPVKKMWREERSFNVKTGTPYPEAVPTVDPINYRTLHIDDIFQDAEGNVYKVYGKTKHGLNVLVWSEKTGRWLSKRNGKNLGFTSPPAGTVKQFKQSTDNATESVRNLFHFDDALGSKKITWTADQLTAMNQAVERMGQNGFNKVLADMLAANPKGRARIFSMGGGSRVDLWGRTYGSRNTLGAYWNNNRALGIASDKSVKSMVSTWIHEFGHHLDYSLFRNRGWVTGGRVVQQAGNIERLRTLDAAYRAMVDEYRNASNIIGKRLGLRMKGGIMSEAQQKKYWHKITNNMDGAAQSSYSLRNEKEWIAETFSAYFNGDAGTRALLKQWQPKTAQFFETLFSTEMEPLWREMLR